MSKRIDTSAWPLSNEDRAYMLSRGREGELAELDRFHADLDNADLPRVEAPQLTDDVEIVDEPYNKWKVNELNDEINARNAEREDVDKIVTAGTNKADLVAALEADDIQNPVTPA